MEKIINDPKFINKSRGEQEIEWWGNKPKNLINVPDTGEHYRLIYTLRSEKEPKQARPEVILTIEEVGKRWRQRLEELGIKNNQKFFLSITSLYRDENLQKQLKSKSVNANDTSSHLLGAAADIDPNAFYLLGEDEEFKPINAKNYPAEEIDVLRKSLFGVLNQMQREGMISFIPEYEPRENNVSTLSCFHICPKPEDK